MFGFLLYPGHLHGSNGLSGGRARRTKSEAWRLYIYLQHSGPEQTGDGKEEGKEGTPFGSRLVGRRRPDPRRRPVTTHILFYYHLI